MELTIREAKARLSELVAAAGKGERVIITRHGLPAVELVRCDRAAESTSTSWKRRASASVSRATATAGQGS